MTCCKFAHHPKSNLIHISWAKRFVKLSCAGSRTVRTTNLAYSSRVNELPNNVLQVRASSAPLWNPRVMRQGADAAPANGGAPSGRQTSLWAYHPPADQALRNARSAAASRLRQDIELYRENSFQREMLQQRVGERPVPVCFPNVTTSERSIPSR